MVWEDWRGDERRVSFGELQDLSCRFANVLRANGVERGDRVATLLPSLPETAAIFLGTYRAGAILLSMSVLYGDEGIEHRLRDSQAKVVVTDAANRDRIPDGLADDVLVLDGGLLEDMADASTRFETVDTAADDPAQLYYSSGTTGMAKGILHAHRYLLAHEEFEFCHDVRDGELFHGSGEWAWAAGICPLLGPWRYGAVALVQARKGGYDPEEHLRFLSKHGVENMFTTPTALRAMTGVEDAGTRFPLDRAAHHLLRRRAAQPRGDPLVPRAVRSDGARLLRADRELPAVRQLPDGRGARGLDGPARCRAGRWRSSTRTSSRCRRASAARSACGPARTRTTRSATGTGPRTRRRCSAATGSTPRTRPSSTRTATSGTPAGPTT